MDPGGAARMAVPGSSCPIGQPSSPEQNLARAPGAGAAMAVPHHMPCFRDCTLHLIREGSAWSSDWQQARAYFVAFLNPSRDNRCLPLPPGWPASTTVDEPAAELGSFTLMPLCDARTDGALTFRPAAVMCSAAPGLGQ